ncbi:hypothetical protein N7471_012998 [Penicillium samsonianum]|uniref:uncharacterized protein n=1 Tax=Penicillium samsonianum TaxID=1882272 RepID=UPI002548E102|nr:uncharacterized protein N7471_012998 [Penicillium samsonianum]KAJ6119047.1 hypothetical protein N7471_012998 [Penicillium samsonianum]
MAKCVLEWLQNQQIQAHLGADWKFHLAYKIMNKKLQLWGLTRDGTVLSGMEISEEVRMFGGEVQVTKSVVVRALQSKQEG